MKKCLVSALVLCLVAVLAACGSDDRAAGQGQGGQAAAGEEEVKLGIANFTLCCSYFIGMAEAVEREAEAAGNVTVSSTDAGADAAKLTSDVNDLIAKGVDGIIISAGPLESAPAALDAIKQAGIPMVMVDRKLTGGDYTSWVGPDNEAMGRSNGEYIVDQLKGQGRLAVIKGGPADNTIGLARTNGMKSQVEPTGIEMVEAPDFAEWSEDGGLRVMGDLLASNKDLDAVFCENDSMCLGAQRAIQDAGRSKDIKVFGIDGQKEALKAIMDGTNYKATALNDSDQIGTEGFKRLMAILQGQQAEKDTVLPSPLITEDNAKRFYDPESVF